MNDTIAALATSLGIGAISIIRVSGNDAIKIVKSIFKGKDLSKVEDHTINYGFIVDGNKKIKNLKYEVSKIAEEVLNSKIEAHLDPMNSYERRIVHTLVSEYKNLETISEGEEPNRYVVIKYKETLDQ